MNSKNYKWIISLVITPLVSISILFASVMLILNLPSGVNFMETYFKSLTPLLFILFLLLLIINTLFLFLREKTVSFIPIFKLTLVSTIVTIALIFALMLIADS